MNNLQNKNLPVLIVSGLSGAGKSTALDVLEDLGFFCVDNLPAKLVTPLISLVTESNKSKTNEYKGIALGINLRQLELFEQFGSTTQTLVTKTAPIQVLYLEAAESVLLKRYAATRRPHPLEAEYKIGLQQAICFEQEQLMKVRRLADAIIDTSNLTIHDLRRMLQRKWQSLEAKSNNMKIHVVSFGFKYGVPAEADQVYDLRFLPNPHFVEKLQPLSGLEQVISDYVLLSKIGKSYYTKLLQFLLYSLPLYETEGRYRVCLALGCTGGRHRSVAIAERLSKDLTTQKYIVSTEHKHLSLYKG